MLFAGLGLAALVGCFDGDFLRLEQCTEESDCGRGQDCVEGLCIECSGDVCSPYECPVEEVDGVCPCPGRAKFECQQLSAARTNKVDILFVVDNSGPALQTRLLDYTHPLLEKLDARLVDYRVAMTTTDMGNPACPEGATTPAQGDFVLSSCLARLDDFEGIGFDATADCLDRCAHETIETAQPWLEISPTGTNFDGDITVEEALACTLLPGVNGCGFEAPLESLYQALTKAQSSSEANSGFIRKDAHLLVVMFTDQADCSSNPAYSNIFESDGGQVFWSESPGPTPAICWNAGVECIGGPDPYYDCIAVDKDSEGAPTLDGDAAVLHPVERYTSALQGLAQDKQAELSTLEVVVVVIAGVPNGGATVYQSTGMDDFEEQFGIAPSCQIEVPNGGNPVEAVPPVRMLEFAEAVDGPGESDVYSVCASEFDTDNGPFEDITEALETSFPPLCMPVCVAEPANCELGYVEDGATVEIPQCETDVDDKPVRGSEELCFFTRTGEQVEQGCLDQGLNVQFGVLHATGREVPDQLYASCEPATTTTECPTSG